MKKILFFLTLVFFSAIFFSSRQTVWAYDQCISGRSVWGCSNNWSSCSTTPDSSGLCYKSETCRECSDGSFTCVAPYMQSCTFYQTCTCPVVNPTSPPNNPTATPIPTATPKPPTATPIPTHPSLCQSATISKTTLGPGERLIITSTANSPDIKTFSYAFYNQDNRYAAPDNTPKPIYFIDGTHYIRSDNTNPPVNPPSHSITVIYDELNKPDLNWGSGTQKPTKIQVNAYFINSQGQSLSDINCVVAFDITASATPIPPTATPIPGCTKKPQGDANCDQLVNILDYEIWRQEFTGASTDKTADFDRNGSVTIVDYEIWRQGFVNSQINQ